MKLILYQSLVGRRNSAEGILRRDHLPARREEYGLKREGAHIAYDIRRSEQSIHIISLRCCTNPLSSRLVDVVLEDRQG
jgi:hypothetical protein